MYDIFLSYRRDLGSQHATAFEAYLASKGYTIYLDINTKFVGDYEKVIMNTIKESYLMVLILTKGSITRMENREDISYKEIKFAMDNNIPIIPVTVVGDTIFEEFHNPNLPEEVKKLAKYNTRFYEHEMRVDTFNYIEGLLKIIKQNYFKDTFDKFLDKEGKIVGGNLNPFIKEVTNHVIRERTGEKLVYTGTLKNDVPFGEGKLVNTNNNTLYELNWNPYDNLSGVGKVYKNGKLYYEGEVKELALTGQGRLEDYGIVEKGHFYNGKLNGEGSRRYSDGKIVNGYFNSGETLNATINYPDNSIYVGKTIQDVPNGKGVLIKKGIHYDGRFRLGHFEEGAMIEEERIIIGQFMNQGGATNYEPEGTCVIYDTDYNVLFEGRMKKGKPQGLGVVHSRHVSSDKVLPVEVFLDLKEKLNLNSNTRLTIETDFDGNNIVDRSELIIKLFETKEVIFKGKVKHSSPFQGRYELYKDGRKIHSFDNYFS